MTNKLIKFVVLICAITLSTIVMSMSFVLLFGLFDPSIDNTEIFKIFEPAFQTIVGGMIGILSGVKISQGATDES